VREAKFRRVEKIAVERRQLLLSHPQLLRRAIQRIANDGVLERGEVHSNLMRAARVELDLDESRAVNPGEGFPVGEGPAGIGDSSAAPGFAVYRHARAINRVAPDGEVDAASFFGKDPLHQSDVSLLDSTAAEGFAEFGVSRVILGDQDDAGSFLVQAMNDAGTKRIAALRERLTAAEQRVDERAGNIARAGVYGHPGSFVDRDKIVVFVEDIERDGFCLGVRGGAFRDFDRNPFAPTQLRRAFARKLVVDANGAGLDEFLNTSAA